ncbi:MAG: hypothetical protein AAGE59_00185 [Cyanobacteria bacterium P01_F01_bin.86]
MESLQEQVTVLTQKVDALHQTIDQVHTQVSEILSKSLAQPSGNNGVLDDSHYARINSRNSSRSFEPPIIHKDVLVDSDYIDPERSGEETSLSTEVQIQRLTAQLTAAYNRIAALEEQLLASRVH